MAETLRERINRMESLLDKYDPAKPLPISIQDIYFIIGACGKLLSSIDNLENSYKKDIKVSNDELCKFRDKWKEARQIGVSLDNELMMHKHILREAENLCWWRKSKALKLVLKSFYMSQKKHVKEDKKNELKDES